MPCGKDGKKKVSKTDNFKAHVQAIVKQVLGVKVSKAKAWELFKAIMNGTLEFTAKDEQNALSLAGIGTFKVLKTAARGKKAGFDADGKPIEGAKVYPFVPRAKFYYSESAQKYLEQFFGLEDHGVELKDTGLFAKDAEVVEEAEAETATEAAPVAEEL
jgi:nucleoid DNA-binding protein